MGQPMIDNNHEQSAALNSNIDIEIEDRKLMCLIPSHKVYSSITENGQLIIGNKHEHLTAQINNLANSIDEAISA